MQSTKPRVLYLDENAEDSFALTSLLKLADYEPVTTNFVSDALQLAQAEEFDLYILSRRFPVGSGVYLCQKLHEIAPQTPIIFLSDDASASARGQDIRSGSEEYITKSRDAREILDAVRRALSETKDVSAAISF